MHFREVGGLKIYTPRASEEVSFRMLLEAKLRRTIKARHYTGKEANEIIQGLFADAQVELKRLLPRVANHSFFEFLIFTHSLWGRLMTRAQKGLLEHEDAQIYWKRGAPLSAELYVIS